MGRKSLSHYNKERMRLFFIVGFSVVQVYLLMLADPLIGLWNPSQRLIQSKRAPSFIYRLTKKYDVLENGGSENDFGNELDPWSHENTDRDRSDRVRSIRSRTIPLRWLRDNTESKPFMFLRSGLLAENPSANDESYIY